MGNGLSAFKPKSDFIFINSNSSNSDSEKGIYLKELPDETANKKGKVYLGISFFDIEESSPSLVDYLSSIISIFSSSSNEYEYIKNVYGKGSSKTWPERFFLPSIKINEVVDWDKILSELIDPENLNKNNFLNCPSTDAGYDIFDIKENKNISGSCYAANHFSENIFEISKRGIYFASFFSESFSLKEKKESVIEFNNKGMFLSIFLDGKKGPEVLFTTKVVGKKGENEKLNSFGELHTSVFYGVLWVLFFLVLGWVGFGVWRAFTGRARSLSDALVGGMLIKNLWGWMMGRKARFIVRNYAVNEEKFLS